MKSERPEILFNTRTFAGKDPSAALFFICPFGTRTRTARPAIHRLQRSGYEVVAYDTNDDVFYGTDTSILVDLISGIKDDMKGKISELKERGFTDFGFFGNSLGSFILYNCINDIKELKWGIFNTGGNIAEAMWRIKKPRQLHEAKGISLDQLKEDWHELQYPHFEDLDGHRYTFVSSTADQVAPMEDVEQYAIPVRNAGASVDIIGVKALNHASAVVVGMAKAVTLLDQVRSQVGPAA